MRHSAKWPTCVGGALNRELSQHFTHLAHVDSLSLSRQCVAFLVSCKPALTLSQAVRSRSMTRCNWRRRCACVARASWIGSELK